MIDTTSIKTALLAKLKELEARAHDIEEDLAAKPDSDWEEDAIESEDDEVLAAIGDLTLDDIRGIKLALSRIEMGTYGICSACGSDIAKARLRVLPHAVKCIKCA